MASQLCECRRFAETSFLCIKEQQCSPGNVQVHMDTVFGRDPQEVCLARTRGDARKFSCKKIIILKQGSLALWLLAHIPDHFICWLFFLCSSCPLPLTLLCPCPNPIPTSVVELFLWGWSFFPGAAQPSHLHNHEYRLHDGVHYFDCRQAAVEAGVISYFEHIHNEAENGKEDQASC